MGSTSASAPPDRNLNQEASQTLGTNINLANTMQGAMGSLGPTQIAQNLGLLSQVFGQPDWQRYSQTDEVQRAYQNQLATDPNAINVYPNVEAFAKEYYQNVGRTQGTATVGVFGGLLDLNKQLTQQAIDQTAAGNTALRQGLQTDVAALSPQVMQTLQAANPNYYNALTQFSQSASAPVQQSAAQQQFGNMASTGFGSFDPTSLYANTNFSAQQIAAPTDYQQVSAQQVNAPQGMLSVNAPQGNAVLSSLAARSLGSGQSNVLQQEQGLASNLLALGGNLSADELRGVQQASRAAYASRGLDATNASMLDEVLKTNAAQRQRLAENLGLAQGVESQIQSQQALQNQLGLGASSQALGYGQLGVQGQQSNQQALQNLQSMGLTASTANQAAALQASLANQNAYQNLQKMALDAAQQNQAANLQAQQLGLQAQQANQGFGLNAFGANLSSQTAQADALKQAAALQESQRLSALQAQQAALAAQQSAYVNPYQVIGSQNTGNVGTNTGLFGMGSSLTDVSGLNSFLNPFNAYASDLYNTNYNAQAAANIANANNNASLLGGAMGMFGMLGGGLLGNAGLFGSATKKG